MKEVVAVISGGFDPLHEGHLDLIRDIREFMKNSSISSFNLVALVNSNEWLDKKKGYHLLDINCRLRIMNNIQGVTRAIPFEDDDLGSASKGLKLLATAFGNEAKIMFFNGGDRNRTEIPEADICRQYNISMVDLLQSGKPNSSSSIFMKALESYTKQPLKLENAPKSDIVEKPWGYYQNLYKDDDKFRVKLLVINPFDSISLQQHFKRTEFWLVLSGNGIVMNDGRMHNIKQSDTVFIERESIHQIKNSSREALKILEIWQTKDEDDKLSEEDIIRLRDPHHR